jgi:hypothetical protein
MESTAEELEWEDSMHDSVREDAHEDAHDSCTKSQTSNTQPDDSDDTKVLELAVTAQQHCSPLVLMCAASDLLHFSLVAHACAELCSRVKKDLHLHPHIIRTP